MNDYGNPDNRMRRLLVKLTFFLASAMYSLNMDSLSRDFSTALNRSSFPYSLSNSKWSYRVQNKYWNREKIRKQMKAH